MQARMNHPAMILPEAMNALMALAKSTENRASRQRPSASSSCGRARSTVAACAWTCTGET